MVYVGNDDPDLLAYTDNLLYTDSRYNDKIRYNDNLTFTKPSLKL